ncbi:hypothetical protein T484DRAFT_1838090 [Baffinella frigidus]|nr:hypothetical protein T484DRAFT_1838090 [Cryptophyta sp. CCMP2293]
MSLAAPPAAAEAAFRPPGANKDYLVLGAHFRSVLEFNQERNQFERVHLETFGKSS